MAKEIYERIKGCDCYSEYDFEGKISDIVSSLSDTIEKAEELGYRDIELKNDTLYPEDANFEVWGIRDETDSERDKRLKNEARKKELDKKRKENAKAKKYKEYLKLKKEFEQPASCVHCHSIECICNDIR